MTVTHFGHLHLRFRRQLHTCATSTFVFSDRLRRQLHTWATSTLVFRDRLHALATSTSVFDELYTLATSTSVFDDSYTPPPWHLHLSFRRQLHTLATSTPLFVDSYTLHQLPASGAICDDGSTLWQLFHHTFEHLTGTISAECQASQALSGHARG